MKNEDPVLDDLCELKGVVHPLSSNPQRHRIKTMQHVFEAAARSESKRWRYLLGGGGLCLLAGLSYATGLVQTISEWIVTVETIDPETDRVTLENTEDPELDFTVDVPNTETQDLVDAAESNELFVFEVLEEEPAQGTSTLLVTPIDEPSPAPTAVEMLAANGTPRLVEVPRD